jgi:NitT/TauT family transport system permease protein
MKPKKIRLLSSILPPAILFVAIVAAGEAYIRIAQVPGWLMEPPSAIALAMLNDGKELFSAMAWTAIEAITGFVASAVVGILFAILLSVSRRIRSAVYPYTIFFQTVPIIAIAPLLVIWIGFGAWPVIVCAFIVSVFPVIVNTLIGLLSTDPMLNDLFRLYGATPLATMWKLRLPSALPSIFAGLRVAAGLSVIGTVVAEFTVGHSVGEDKGLGILIVNKSHLDVVLAAVVLASLLGLVMFAAVNFGGRIFLRRWHPSER